VVIMDRAQQGLETAIQLYGSVKESMSAFHLYDMIYIKELKQYLIRIQYVLSFNCF
jgi:hypothetical protein